MKINNTPFLTKSPSHNGFTLVELIVVITILVILGTIAFINLGGFAGSARDSARVSDLTNITQGLEMFSIKSGTLPPPEAPTGGGIITLTASGGGIIGYQGVAGNNTLSIIKMSNTQDPTDKKYYAYVTNGKYTKYQLLALMEDNSTNVVFNAPGIDQTFAGYETRIPTTKGYALGALLATSGAYLNQPLQEIVTINTSLDLQNFSGTLAGANIGNITIYFTKSDSISGTGNTISTPIQISMNNGGNGFNTPSTCPNGFVAVPGNKDFNQPGFCVSKYAMTYSDADVPDSTGGGVDWNTIHYTTTKTPVSIPNKYPIADITQPQAITACASLGAGYHLITNNEWMTIARNIEQQGDNWSTGIVGSGGIYRGITGEGTVTVNSLGCNTADSAGASGISGRIYVAKPLATDTTRFGTSKGADCDSKRQHKLSSGQIVWDMAGNIWSHVNKGNTMDGSNFNDANSWKSDACSGVNNWQAFSTGATADGVNTCNYTNGYSYANQGPKTPNLNATNGIGRIYSYNTASNVFLRGGHAGDGTFAGVFALSLHWGASATYRTVGFRCAR